MSEWSIEHAWKTTPANCIESHRNTSSRNRVNDFPPHHASRCEPVNVGVYRWFRGDLTQFLHSSERHLLATPGCLSVRNEREAARPALSDGSLDCSTGLRRRVLEHRTWAPLRRCSA